MAVSQIQEIKDKLDIVDVIGERISLQRSGKNFRGNCPFHSEKTPSFFVSPDIQHYKCFGCGKQGDVLTFIQEFDRLTFPEALEILAERAGVELQQEWKDPKEEERRRIFEVLELAQKYYTYLLTEHKIGAAALEYLQQRQLNTDTRRNFGIGYAPAQWESLVNYLTKKKKFTPEEVEKAGLAIRGRGGRYYDRFRDRLMFPLHDHRGRVVGFSGRLLNKEAKEAKYINTPETEVYHKRYLLYGYWQNLEAIREKESVIITEGEFDVLSSVQAHVKNVVAVKGSALTEEQVRLLSRTVQTIYLALDADSAGVEATKRAIALVQSFPVALRVIPLLGGKDPDDMARQNPAQWRDQTKKSITAFEYVLEAVVKEHGLDSAQGHKRVTDTMFDVLLQIEHAVERTFYLKQLAERLQVTERIIEEQWEQRQKRQQASQLSQHRRTEEPERPSPVVVDQLGRYYLQLLLRFPQRFEQKGGPTDPQCLQEPGLQRIFAQHDEWMKTREQFILKEFVPSLPAELQELISDLYLEELPIEDTLLNHELTVTATQLQQRWRKDQLDKLGKQLEKLEGKESLTTAEEEQYGELQRQLQVLTQH